MSIRSGGGHQQGRTSPPDRDLWRRRRQEVRLWHLHPQRTANVSRIAIDWAQVEEDERRLLAQRPLAIVREPR